MIIDPIAVADIEDATVPSSPAPPQGTAASRTFLSEDFEEVRLFALLLWRFGRPNGFLSFLGPPDGDPDGPFKWDFIFELEKLVVNVIRTVSGIEVRWWGRQSEAEPIQRFLIRNIESHAQQIDEAISRLESYTLILNPYVRHRSMARLARDELASIEVPKVHCISLVSPKKEDVRRMGEDFSRSLQIADRQAMFQMTLATSAAYMAESYLNLMYAVLLRDEIRSSRAMLEESLRRKWKSKVERLPVDCKYIAKTPDLGDKRIRDAKEMFELRNRIAHSYPDREKMKVGHMWFHRRFPILPLGVPAHNFAIAMNNQLPSRKDALFAMKAAEGLTSFLHELIEPKIQDEFDRFVNAQPLGYNETKSIYGVPFGSFAILTIAMG